VAGEPRPLAGRVAVVTGVSRRAGIGFAISWRLAALGADLFVHSFAEHDSEHPWGRDPGGIAAVLQELRATGRRVEHVDVDFRDPHGPDRVMAAATGALGHVDVLVANH